MYFQGFAGKLEHNFMSNIFVALHCSCMLGGGGGGGFKKLGKKKNAGFEDHNFFPKKKKTPPFLKKVF